MKTPTKKEIVKACRVLARGYKSDTLDHSNKSCPLCKLFYTVEYSSIGDCQSNCPNMVFSSKPVYINGINRNMGCLDRQNLYRNLNWGSNFGNEKLAIFWTKVGNYLTRQKPENVENICISDRIKSRIKLLADEIDQEIM